MTAVSLQLAQTQSLIQTLLADIRENSFSQADLNAELKHLRTNVQILSNIIRGDDGNTKPLLMEVELLKHSNSSLEKKLTAHIEDNEKDISSISENISSVLDRIQSGLDSLRKEIEAKIDNYEKSRKEGELEKMKLQAAQANDIRLDGRSRFQTWATIIVAIISLIGSTVAILLK